MKSKYQLVIKITAFLGIFCLLFSYFTKTLIPKDGAFATTQENNMAFNDQPENSIDVLFLGASTFFQGISPLFMWEDYGFSGYVRAISGQAPAVSYYYLVESLKYQKPAVVVIDTTSLFADYDVDEKEGKLRIAIDPMNLSAEKLELVMDVVSRSERQTVISYLFPLLRYHSRWDDLDKLDFTNDVKKVSYPYKGFSGIRIETGDLEFPEDYMQPTDTVTPFSKDSLNYFEKMIRLCQENDIGVVIVTLPRVNWDYSRHLAVKQLADTYNIQDIDYCLDELLDATDIHTTTDFWDELHLNILGAQKVSHHLGAYLQETFDLNDKRNDPAYQQWNIDLQTFKNDIARAIAAAE